MTSGLLDRSSSGQPLPHRVVLNARPMPTYAHGHRSPMGWGTLGFCATEGMGFAVGLGAYFYLVFINGRWPLAHHPPDLLWASMHTALLLLSLWPNHLAKKNAEREDPTRVRRDLVIMSLIGIVLLVLRILEFEPCTCGGTRTPMARSSGCSSASTRPTS